MTACSLPFSQLAQDSNINGCSVAAIVNDTSISVCRRAATQYRTLHHSCKKPDTARNKHIHRESKKLCHYTFVHNFDKCWPIFKILSLLYSVVFSIHFCLKKLCYNVSLCENCQRQSCKAFTGLSIRAKMTGGGDPFYLKFWIKLIALERNRRFSIYFRS